MSDPVRESMKNNLPIAIQPFLTWLTSRPFEGQKAWESRGLDYLITAIFMVVLAVILGVSAINKGGIFLLFIPFCWILVTSGVTQLRLTVMHACSHKSLLPNKWRKLDDKIGEWITVATMSLCFKEYRPQHTKIHHSENLMESGDSTYDFLLGKLGLEFGISKKELWKRLWSRLLLPQYHIEAFFDRVKLAFFSPDWKHNIRSIVFWSVVFWSVIYLGVWLQFLIVWVVPFTLMYEISFALRHCVEHSWATEMEFNSKRERMPYLTKAVFLGEQAPNKTDSIVKWGIWWLHMLFYHLPVRLMVLTADSTCHDYHHRNPCSNEWRNGIFARENDAMADSTYAHSWGLLETIDDMFAMMSRKHAEYLHF